MIKIEGEGYTLHRGDCLDVMPGLAAGSVDAIICDLPYGVTSCAWDSVIPLDKLWPEFNRVIKPRGAVVLFGSQPFTTVLAASNIDQLKHVWIWNKRQSGSFQNAQYGPLRITEDVLVFSLGRINYYPQMRKGVFRRKGGEYRKHKNEISSGLNRDYVVWNDDYFPTNLLNYAAIREGLHPTQKPVDLLAYLIRTYTNPGETVLDCTFGSGTTGVAALQTGRRFIGCEISEEYFAIAHRRIEDASRAAAGLPKQLNGHVTDWSESPLFQGTQPCRD